VSSSLINGEASSMWIPQVLSSSKSSSQPMEGRHWASAGPQSVKKRVKVLFFFWSNNIRWW
jgi:hypothetical protein